jgi:hypothetical protein
VIHRSYNLAEDNGVSAVNVDITLVLGIGASVSPNLSTQLARSIANQFNYNGTVNVTLSRTTREAAGVVTVTSPGGTITITGTRQTTEEVVTGEENVLDPN